MPRFACPSCRRMTTSGTPSCAISTAWACRSWCGANRRLTPAPDAVDLDPGVELVPCPAVHPDVSALASISTPDQYSAAGAIEVALLERECLADPQSGTPQQHNQRTVRITAMISSTVGGSAGYCSPLFRGGRPRWLPGMVAGERRGRRRQAADSMNPPLVGRLTMGCYSNRAAATAAGDCPLREGRSWCPRGVGRRSVWVSCSC